MKKLMSIFFLFCLILSHAGFTNDKKSKLPGKTVETEYEACKNVLLVDKNSYKGNEKKWDEASKDCGLPVVLTHDVGISDINPLAEHIKYLGLAQMVASQVKTTMTRNKLYAQCTTLCFMGSLEKCSASYSPEGKEILCSERKKEVLQSMKVNARRARIELALSTDSPSAVNVTVENAMKLPPDRFINTNLRDFESGPNPTGRSAMTDREIKEAKRRLEVDFKRIDEEAQQLGKENDSAFKALRRLQNFEKHQENYRQIIYTESPVFAFIGRPDKIQDGEPSWKDEDIGKAYQKIAEITKDGLEALEISLKEKKVEFSRQNLEALAKRAFSMLPGVTERKDLLYYMTMKSQVEEVLKEHPDLCGIANTMNQRMSAKQIQNAGSALVVSIGGGAALKTAGGFINLGRALTTAEASTYVGAVVGLAYFGDTAKKYSDVSTETKIGLRTTKEYEDVKDELALSIAMAPLGAGTGLAAGKGLYGVLSSRMGKNVPEIASLLNNGKLDAVAKEKMLHRWFVKRVEEISKKNWLTPSEKQALQDKNAKDLLNSLAEEITKTHPDFFSDPKNLDFFLKAAGTTLKKQTGDPDDLMKKTQSLLLAFNREAVEGGWDPKAQQGLLMVLDKAMDELRHVYKNDPATYAKFTSDKESKIKVMKAALRRAGVKTEKEIDEMATCGLRI